MGRGQQDQFRPDCPPEYLRQGPDLLRSGIQRTLRALCHRALPGRGADAAGFPVQRLRRGGRGRGEERRAHSAAPPSGAGSLQGRRAASEQEAGR